MEPESRPEPQDPLSNGSLLRDPNGWQTVEPAAASTAVEDDEEEEQPARTRFLLPLGLFLLTVFTTLWAGAYQTNSDTDQGPWQFLLQEPSALWKGIPFAATLLGILVTHEFGHYLFSKIHRVPATLPLFIPGPPHFIGTFGAIIRMKPILNRKALFDIGVAGPIAGFLVALVMLAIGLKWSKVVTVDETFGLHLGEPLLLQFMSSLIIGDIPPRAAVILHPVGFAAWFGLFVTSLNLIPIGQLDGGHVAYALWGKKQRTIAMVAVPILIVLGFQGWPGWFLWVGMAGLLGLSHPPVLDPSDDLGPTRTVIGWLALAIFILTFAPVPLSVH